MLISTKKRLLLFFVAVLFFLGIFYAGYSFKMDESFSKELSKNFINQIKDIDEFGIFFNNLKIALVMFIPIIGIIMGTISGFSTGLVFNSIMDLSGTASYTNPLIIFFFFFAPLALFCSLASRRRCSTRVSSSPVRLPSTLLSFSTRTTATINEIRVRRSIFPSMGSAFRSLADDVRRRS